MDRFLGEKNGMNPNRLAVQFNLPITIGITYQPNQPINQSTNQQALKMASEKQCRINIMLQLSQKFH